MKDYGESSNLELVFEGVAVQFGLQTFFGIYLKISLRY